MAALRPRWLLRDGGEFIGEDSIDDDMVATDAGREPEDWRSASRMTKLPTELSQSSSSAAALGSAPRAR